MYFIKPIFIFYYFGDLLVGQTLLLYTVLIFFFFTLHLIIVITYIFYLLSIILYMQILLSLTPEAGLATIGGNFAGDFPVQSCDSQAWSKIEHSSQTYYYPISALAII